MKTTLKFILTFCVLLILGCGGDKKSETVSYGKKDTATKKETPKETKVAASMRVDLNSKGVGPITSLTLPAEIDQDMATHGKEVYDKLCTACHRADKKFIGPSPTGILERRTPEWVMNMILDPEGMVANDALAKELLIEFNGSPMANQNLTEEEARAVLEYFRTLK